MERAGGGTRPAREIDHADGTRGEPVGERTGGAAQFGVVARVEAHQLVVAGRSPVEERGQRGGLHVSVPTPGPRGSVRRYRPG